MLIPRENNGTDIMGQTYPVGRDMGISLKLFLVVKI